MRTLAYIANRPDWLHDPSHWQALTKGLEERLSDTLHEKLMARFIDRRTSVLMRQLGERGDLYAGVAEDGTVTVEGHFVGKLKGLSFEQPRAATTLEEKALRGAARRAVGPEIARRLGELAAEPDEAFGVTPDGTLLWRGAAAGAVARDKSGERVRLLGELGPEPARERAARRLEAWLAAEGVRRLGSLRALQAAMADGKLRGLPRGLAHRLIEAGGVMDRRPVEADLRALSQAERRTLRSLGVRIGAFSLFLPSLLQPQALAFAQALEGGPWRAPTDRLSRLPSPPPSARALAARGLRAVGALAVPVEQLERLDELLRNGPKHGGGQVLTDEARQSLGWGEADARTLLKGLDYAPVNREAPVAWRRRRDRLAQPAAAPPPPSSPFAALAQLTAPPPAPGSLTARRRRKPRRKARTA